MERHHQPWDRIGSAGFGESSHKSSTRRGDVQPRVSVIAADSQEQYRDNSPSCCRTDESIHHPSVWFWEDALVEEDRRSLRQSQNHYV